MQADAGDKLVVVEFYAPCEFFQGSAAGCFSDLRRGGGVRCVAQQAGARQAPDAEFRPPRSFRAHSAGCAACKAVYPKVSRAWGKRGRSTRALAVVPGGHRLLAEHSWQAGSGSRNSMAAAVAGQLPCGHLALRRQGRRAAATGVPRSLARADLPNHERARRRGALLQGLLGGQQGHVPDHGRQGARGGEGPKPPSHRVSPGQQRERERCKHVGACAARHRPLWLRAGAVRGPRRKRVGASDACWALPAAGAGAADRAHVPRRAGPRQDLHRHRQQDPAVEGKPTSPVSVSPRAVGATTRGGKERSRWVWAARSVGGKRPRDAPRSAAGPG